MPRDWHRVIYIPAPAGIDQEAVFTAIGEDLRPVTYAWGQNPRENETVGEAIKAQKKGYRQIAGKNGAPDGSAHALLRRFKEKRTGSAAENLLFQSADGGGLAHLTNPETVLYVDSHGNSVVTGFRPYSLSPAGLAELLNEHEGLPTTIKWIKLFSCYSGEEAGQYRDGEIYARQFSAYMSDFYGYKNLTVYGYLGELKLYKDGSRIVETSFRGTGPARNFRREFKSGVEVKS